MTPGGPPRGRARRWRSQACAHFRVPKHLTELLDVAHRACSQAGAEQGQARHHRSTDLVGKSINNVLTILRRMLVIARKRGLSAVVPEIDWLKVPAQEFDFLDFEEAKRLLAALDEGWHTMVLVALRTGMRMGELIALRWQDVDLVAGKITVCQNAVKGRARLVRCTSVLRRYSRRHREVYRRAELQRRSPRGPPAQRHDRRRRIVRRGLRQGGWVSPAGVMHAGATTHQALIRSLQVSSINLKLWSVSVSQF